MTKKSITLGDNGINPIVSVIMPVYNAEKYVNQAVESILKQSFHNFEFIIIDDGSTDATYKILKTFTDRRIRLVSQKNRGVSAARNEAVKLGKGKYFAMQDADDVSHNQRLQKQVEFLEEHPHIGLLGTNYTIVHDDGRVWFTTNMFTHHDDIKLALVFSNQFGQGTMMIRRELLSSNVYDISESMAEDYDLWTKLLKKTKSSNLKESFYTWRYHAKSASTSNQDAMNHAISKIIKREFNYFLKNKHSYNLLSFHPFSTNEGFISYLKMKNSMFRNMAIMYCRSGLRRKAVSALLLAIILTPWQLRTYIYLWTVIFRKNKINQLVYDNYIK